MTPKTATGDGRIVGLATAVPPLTASVDEVWDALGKARGRRMSKLQSDEGARTRHFAQPLTSLMERRTQSQQTDAYLEHARVFRQHNGGLCPVCGTPIEKTRVAGRGTHFCPKCQRLSPSGQKSLKSIKPPLK